MNILFLTTHLNTGGITSYLLSLTRSLRQRGHKVFVASAGGDCESILEAYGGKHFNLGFRTKSEADLRIYLKLGFLKKFVKQYDIDVIHAQTRVTQVMGKLLSSLTHKPLVTTCHGFFKPKFFRQIFPCCGDAVIAISKPVSEHLVKDLGVDQEKIHMVIHGVDCERFPLATDELKGQMRKQWGIESSKVIGIIARFSVVKGIDILLKSMPLVVKQYPDVLLMIVGEGPQQDELLSLVESLNLKEHVRFEKVLNQPADLLPTFDIFVMPSRQEGLGLSVMEAQACGLPVVASNIGGLVDLIEEGKTGYLVASQDSQALALKIIEVLKDITKAKEVGKAARDYIGRKFTLEQMVVGTEKVYDLARSNYATII
ncbi:MAG: glycosyltransferase family 4 protein [Candidatus Omnitrophota bacterium]